MESYKLSQSKLKKPYVLRIICSKGDAFLWNKMLVSL